MANCLHCKEPLRFEPDRGWVHAEGGAYAMRCDSCGWTGAPAPSPGSCPNCGDRHQLRDDHCVLPDRRGS